MRIQKKEKENFGRKYYKVIDEKKYIYQISEDSKIGEGAQGGVYRDKNNPRILVKISYKNGNSLKDRIKKINSFELNDDLNFAFPLTCLDSSEKNYEGYVLELMEDMVPISQFYITNFSNLEEINNWIKETGGYEKRVKILKKIAYNLYMLHSKGLVYGDISLNNIFVSKNEKNFETWFIDCDNIDFYSDVNYTIGTPGFCSPEIRKCLPPYNMEKEKNTIENDIFAFVTLAFRILFLCEPFGGSILEKKDDNESEDDDWDDIEEEDDEKIHEEIDMGKISWVGEGDVENRAIYGLSSNMKYMITPELKELFNRTLGKEGRNIPNTRPSLRVWYEELNNLLLKLNDGECKYKYFDYKKRCKECKKCKNTALITIKYNDGRKQKNILKKIIDDRFVIVNNELGIGKFIDRDKIAIEIYKSRSIDYLKNNTNETIELNESGEILKIKKGNKESIYSIFNLDIELRGIKISIRSLEDGI